MGEPTMKMQVTGPDGNQSTVDDQYIMQNLAAKGFGVQGLSADGMNVHMDDGDGHSYQVPIETAVQQGLGWQTHMMTPLKADYSAVSPEWRAMTQTLPDDNSRKAFLQGQLTKLGHDSPNVIGSGRDWYAYSPDHGQWVALTNSPEWGKADLAEGALLGGRALSGVGGALLGGMSGGPAGGVLGYPAGGQAFDAATKGYFAATNPDYREAISSHLPEVAKQQALSAGLDTGLQALSAVLPASGAMAAMRSPVSSVVKPLGQFAEETGKLVGKAGSFLGKEFPSEIAATSGYIPGAEGVMGPALAAQAPKDILTGIPKYLGKFAESDFAKKILSDEARGKMLSMTEGLLAPRAPSGTMAEELAGNLHASDPGAYEPTARDVLGNIADRIPGQPQGPAPITGDPMRSGLAKGLETAGGYADLLHDAGSAVMRPVVGATQAGFKTIGAMGKMAQGAGSAMRAAGTIGRPLEMPVYGSSLYQELIKPMSEEQQTFRKPPQYITH